MEKTLTLDSTLFLAQLPLWEKRDGGYAFSLFQGGGGCLVVVYVFVWSETHLSRLFYSL